MKHAKIALLQPGVGLHDSALNCPVLIPLPGDGLPLPVQLTPVVTIDLEEPITLLVVSSESKEAGSTRQLMRPRGAVLRGGDARPYTLEEARTLASTEFAYGKAIHTFVGHYRLASPDEYVDPTGGKTRECNREILSSPRASHIKEGPGAFYFADGGFFIGHWSNNQRCRLGALYSALGYAYEGEWQNDQPHGRGVEHQHPGGVTYAGEFVDGRPHGSGVIYYPRNGSLYVGEFSRGEKHGRGVVFYENGDVFEGHWIGGRRSGAGVSTSVGPCKSTSLAAEWHRDRCRVETLRIDLSYCVPSLQSYIDDGRVTPLDLLESPIGCGVAGLLTALSERVHEVPPLLLRRLERCFDRLDEAHSGEIPAAVLSAAFDPHLHVKGPSVLQGMLRAAGGDGVVSFAAFLHGFLPHFSAGEVQRLLLREIPLDALLRLRGALAGVTSDQCDGFLSLADEKGPNGAMLSANALDAAGWAIGGVRVPRGLVLRLRARNVAERITLSDVLERLYPAADPRAIRRCERVTLDPYIFHAHARAFAELDDAQKGFVAIIDMAHASRRFLAGRARGHECIANPLNALERLIRTGRQRSHTYWDIAGIELSVAFARSADNEKSGAVALADVLRTAYPNLPCSVTYARISQTLCRKRSPVHGKEPDRPIDGLEESKKEPCGCCICTMCRTNGLPLSAGRGRHD